MKKLLLTGLLACAGFAARAQYYLDFSNQQLAVPDRAVAVERVLDGRDGHPAIGFVYRGLGNKPAAVLFRQGLEPDLTAFMQAQLPARPTDHSVVLCLRQLRVSETLGNIGEKASADLAADVYARLPDGYHFVQSTGGHTNARGLETTRLHAGQVALLLSQCVSQLAQADWAATAARPARTLAQLPTDAPVALANGARRGPVPPILRQRPRRGVYHRFEQFLANQPDTSLVFQLDTIRPGFKSRYVKEQWRGVAWVRPLAPDTTGRRLLAPAWGFSDGQQLFVQHNKHFFSLLRQGSFFTFVGEAPLDREYARATSEAQVRGSLMGVASVRTENHTGEPAAYALDMRTGELAPYPGLRAPTRLDTAYVYRPVQDPGPNAVQVFLNGRTMGPLRPGDYLELPWAYFAKPLQLCLESTGAAGSCLYFVPNVAQHNYLKLTSATPSRPWQWVPSAQGEAALDEMDKRRK